MCPCVHRWQLNFILLEQIKKILNTTHVSVDKIILQYQLALNLVFMKWRMWNFQRYVCQVIYARTSGYGHIYVSGQYSHNVHRLTEDDKMINIPISSKHGIKFPVTTIYTICCFKNVGVQWTPVLSIFSRKKQFENFYVCMHHGPDSCL